MQAEQIQPNVWQPPKLPIKPMGWSAWLAAHKTTAAVPLVLAVGIGLWDLLVRWQAYPAFILPGPLLVGRKFLALAADGTLLRHAQVTLVEIGAGAALGVDYRLSPWLFAG
ncbi:MAG: hypothetical protein R3E79_26460 [Caldilineaceae bacterium]